MASASALLQIALALLLSVQSNPAISEDVRRQAVSIASESITVANKAIGQASNTATTDSVSTAPKISTILVPDKPSEKFDMLTYMSKKLKTSGEVTGGLSTQDGSFFWHLVVSGNNMYLEKWNNPEQIVHYRYDNDYIYLVTDNTGAYPYKFNPGIWLKRYMSIGDTIDMRGNTMQELTSDCRISQNSRSWPYKTKLVARYPNLDMGDNIGVQDVILVEYYWGPNFNNTEREYYAKGYGIVKWEHLENGVLRQSVLTNKTFNYSQIQPKPKCYDLDGNLLKQSNELEPSIPQSTDSFVRHLYSCVLNNQNPDQAGVNYWKNNLQSKALTVSQTYKYMYGYQTNISNEDFVNSLYSCIVFRLPDNEGYNYWLNILKNNQDTRENQVQYMLDSATFKENILPNLERLQ